MSITSRIGWNLLTSLSILAGASAVVVGAYIVSRLREGQDVETRLRRIEEILEKLSEEQEKG